MLTFDDVPVDGALDVSSWAEIGFHDKQAHALSVPCQWALVPYPADFRTPEVIAAERDMRQRRLDPRDSGPSS